MIGWFTLKIMLNLKNKTAKQKAKLKSKELAKVKLSKFTKGDFDIEIIGDIKEIDGGIELFAKAFKGKKQCGFGKDGTVEIERFRFYNPPVLVDDVNGDIIRESTDDLTGKIKQRKLKYDPTEAIKQSLIHTISQVAKDGKNIVIGKIGNTTSTFYPSAGANSPVDGWVWRSVASENWATIRATNGTNADATKKNTTTGIYWSYTTRGTFNLLKRFICLFNTAAIPNDDDIDSATLSVHGDTNANAAQIGGETFSVVSSNPASTSNLASTDFDIGDFGSTAYGTRAISGWSRYGYNNFSFNTSGKSFISKTSLTKLGIIHSHDLSNTDPGDVYSYASWRSADYTGTTSDPKLVVEHSASSSIKSINGLAKASIKSRNGLAIASIKSINGLQ